MSTKERKEYCLNILGTCKQQAEQLYGVKTMRLFGSVARGDSHEGSDVDVCVEMEADMLKRYMLKEYLSQLLKMQVDVVRYRKGMNPLLKKEIDRDGIRIF